jgi:predicted ArsR family transcriptional regulator
MDYPTLDQLDTETRVLLALDKLCRQTPLPETVRAVASESGISQSTTRVYLHGLRSRGLVDGEVARTWQFRPTAAGARRANGLRLLKPRQRLIFQTLRKLGEGHMHAIAKAAGISANGVSQSLPAMADRGVIKPVYNSGPSGWVYAA